MLGKGSCEAGSDSWADRQRTGGQRSALVATREASEDMGQGSEMKPKDRQEAESDAWGVGIRGGLAVCGFELREHVPYSKKLSGKKAEH